MKKSVLLLIVCLTTFNSFAIYSITTKTAISIEIVDTDPIAPTVSNISVCDYNQDGFAIFNLTQVIPEILASQAGSSSNYTIVFYETITDAQINGNTISQPATYPNINIWTQTIYYRITNSTTNTFAVGNFNLIVNPSPEANTPVDYLLCNSTGVVGFESFDLNTTIPQILGSINPALTTVTFHTTLAAAQTDTNAISNATSYTNQTIWNQTIYVRVETIATGCYDIVELDLIVNPIPTSSQPNYPQYSLCDTTGAIGFETFNLSSKINEILLGQTGMSVTFYPSLLNAQNDTNAITNLNYTNTTIYAQTLGIRITNTTIGCYVISTMDISVNPLPTLIQPTEPYVLCDDNQDGTTVFNLTTIIPDLLQGANYIITFHETLTDAQIDNNPINTALPYNNINPFTQILYVRAVDPVTGCWSVIPITLNVNPSPIAPVNLENISVCDNDSNPQNAVTAVDLTQRTAAVLAQQPLPASNYIVTYYTNQIAAQTGTSPILNTSNYVASNGQTIWVRVENTVTGCYNISSFQININNPLQLTTPTTLSVCDDDANPNNQITTFDLTVKNNEIVQNTTGFTVTYYPSFSNAQIETNAIVNPTSYVNIFPAVQTLGVVVTNIATGCKSITTLDIRVLPIPTPNTNPPALVPKCDVNNPGDMLEIFDLTTNATYILNGTPNVTLHFFSTQSDALNNVNEILTPASALVGGNVWIKVENNFVDYQGNRCFVLVEQPLTVNPLPELAQPLAPYTSCDDNADGFAIFNLANPQLTATILGSNQLPTNFTITYYATAAGANPTTNTGQLPVSNNYQNVAPYIQNIYIRIVNNATGCVNAIGILTLVVEQYAQATGPQTYTSCDNSLDNNPYDGTMQVDLTQFNPSILNGQNPAIFLISYYHSQANAIAGIGALTPAQAQNYTTQPDTDTIWVRVENSSNSISPACYALTTININIERHPNPIITTPNNTNIICVDYNTNTLLQTLTLNSGIANPAGYTFEWFVNNSLTPIPGATGPTYTVNSPSPTGATRNYAVIAISNSVLGCLTASTPYAVIQSGQAAIPQNTNGYTIVNLSGVQSIIVGIEGYGTYEYSLDNGVRQDSNVFENVSLGSHSITVWDTEGGIYSCDELVIGNIEIVPSQIPAPTGVTTQSFPAGATLANIIVSGTSIQWYASATATTPLPLNTPLVNNTTYYATQTINGVQSVARLAVTINIALGISDNEIFPLQFAPNPVKNILLLKSTQTIKSVVIYNLIGQKVYDESFEDVSTSLDLSNLKTGNYLVKVQGETAQKVIRIVKE